MKFLAKNFSTRQELELEVGKTIDLTPDKKLDTIEGTREELERLGLSDRTTFYGLSCVISERLRTIKEADFVKKTKMLYDAYKQGKANEKKLMENIKSGKYNR